MVSKVILSLLLLSLFLTLTLQSPDPGRTRKGGESRPTIPAAPFGMDEWFKAITNFMNSNPLSTGSPGKSEDGDDDDDNDVDEPEPIVKEPKNKNRDRSRDKPRDKACILCPDP